MSNIESIEIERRLQQAQRDFYRFKTANMLEKPALAESILSNMLDSLQSLHLLVKHGR
jgi:hypothetical protein